MNEYKFTKFLFALFVPIQSLFLWTSFPVFKKIIKGFVKIMFCLFHFHFTSSLLLLNMSLLLFGFLRDYDACYRNHNLSVNKWTIYLFIGMKVWINLVCLNTKCSLCLKLTNVEVIVPINKTIVVIFPITKYLLCAKHW